MELLGTLTYGVIGLGIVVLALKVTQPSWIDPEDEDFSDWLDDDFPDWVNMPTDYAKMELNQVLMEAVDGRVDRVRHLDADSLSDLKRDMVLIALAYGEGCVRHSENRMN